MIKHASPKFKKNTIFNLVHDKSTKPIWQKTCLLDGFTTADTISRAENKGIDSRKLMECKYMLQHDIDISNNQLIEANK